MGGLLNALERESEMPAETSTESWTRLPDRGVVAVRGADARDFLQNLVTNDVEALAPGAAGYGALLTPQGKIQFDFIVFATGDGFLLDAPREAAPSLAQRLGFYRLRAKVEIADRSADLDVVAAWGGPAPAGLAPDPRLAALGFRGIVAAGAVPNAGVETSAEAYRLHRTALGVPEAGADFAYGDAFPHDADLDQLNGVAFAKGCFVGQEVVSRMEHRGTARRRIVQVRGSRLEGGAEIVADGQTIGTIGSVDGAVGLASVRLDRAAEAIAAGRPLTANGNPLELVVPPWARFKLEAAAS